MPRYAAIDIGSNSVRMLAGDATGSNRIVTLAEDREVTRLGESVFRDGVISEAAIASVCGVLGRMAQAYRRHHVTAVRAVATAAVRDASNQRMFLDRASEAIGSPVEIISGQEEARLIHLGVQSRWPHPQQRILIVDVGGGSAELIVGESGRFRGAFSKPLGAVRLTGMFLKSDPPSPSQLTALGAYINERLAGPVRDFQRLKIERAIATSATASAMICAVNRIPRARRLEADRKRATAAQVRKLWRDLAVKGVEKRQRIIGIGPKRAEIIVPGVAVLHRVLESFRLPSIYYCAAGVREGIIADLASRRVGSELSRLSRDQRRVVEAMAQRYGVNLRHIHQIATLAHSLFESLRPVHQLPAEAGRLLEAAVHLYDIGHFISDTGHHKHSEYIVGNSDMPGFPDRERRIIAALCRFHRKSMPGARHMMFQSLPAEDRRTALLLIPLLRLADALDRGKEQRVEGLECEIRGGAVNIQLQSRTPVDLEYWASERVGETFQQVYERTLTVTRSRRS